MWLLWLAGCLRHLDPPGGASDACSAPPSGVHELVVPWGGVDRTARIYVPPTSGPHDAVVDLHALESGRLEQRWYSGWERFGREHDLVVVHPSGLHHSWNAGSCCLWSYAYGVDDLGFLGHLADVLRDDVCVRRIVATGMSNGAMMAQRWACEGHGVDAILPVAGGFVGKRCEGAPVPIVEFHGTDDGFYPYKGSARWKLRPIDETMAIWRRRNQCTDDPPDVTEHGDVVCRTWHCAVRTELCAVNGGGHTWPGSSIRVRKLGPTTDDVDATEAGYALLMSLPGGSSDADDATSGRPDLP